MSYYVLYNSIFLILRTLMNKNYRFVLLIIANIIQYHKVLYTNFNRTLEIFFLTNMHLEIIFLSDAVRLDRVRCTEIKIFISIMHVSSSLHLDSILTFKWCWSLTNMLIKRKCIEFGYIAYRLSLSANRTTQNISFCLFCESIIQIRYVNFFSEYAILHAIFEFGFLFIRKDIF